MKKLKLFFLIFIIALVCANAAVFFTDAAYIYKALIYQSANIDDLDLFPYRTIHALENNQAWPRTADYNQNNLSHDLRSVLENYQSVAFMVIENGQIRHEEYWDGYSGTVNSNPFSAAKSIVGALVGIALSKGQIKSLDQPVGDFLPEFNKDAKKTITIKDVLRMASGLNFVESYNKPFSHTTDAYYGKDLKKLIYSLKVIEKPGAIYRYKSGDTMLLGMVLTAATGKSLSQYAQEELWQPLGATRDAQWSLDHEGGLEKAYCCFYSNAADLARIGYLYLNGGMANGKQLIPESYVKKSISPIGLVNDYGEKVDYYGYQWWLYPDKNNPVFYARGLLGQYIFVIPSRNMVVVRLGKKRSNIQVNHHPEDVHAIIKDVLETF